MQNYRITIIYCYCSRSYDFSWNWFLYLIFTEKKSKNGDYVPSYWVIIWTVLVLSDMDNKEQNATLITM